MGKDDATHNRCPHERRKDQHDSDGDVRDKRPRRLCPSEGDGRRSGNHSLCHRLRKRRHRHVSPQEVIDRQLQFLGSDEPIALQPRKGMYALLGGHHDLRISARRAKFDRVGRLWGVQAPDRLHPVFAVGQALESARLDNVEGHRLPCAARWWARRHIVAKELVADKVSLGLVELRRFPREIDQGAARRGHEVPNAQIKRCSRFLEPSPR